MRTLLLTLMTMAAMMVSPARASEPIADAELRFNEAARTGDRAALHRILSDTFVYQHGSGRNLDKATYIGMLLAGEITVATRGALQLRSHDYGDTVVSYGESAMSGTVFGQAYDGRLRFVNVWRREGSAWTMVHRNSELLPHPGR